MLPSIMSTSTTLCAEITKTNMLVKVDGIIINKRVGKVKSKVGGRAAFNFVLKDIVGDTVNVVYWDRPEELLKINLILRLGNAFRFAALKSVDSARSRSMNPKTTCPYVLQMSRWSVEKLPEKTEQKLMEIFTSPPPETELTPIPELLSATTSVQINLLAVVVAVGEERRVYVGNGDSASAVDLEVVDNSLMSILVTLWDPELTAFIKEQIIVCDSVILLQDAKLRCPANRSNYVSATSQTLVTPNVSGKSAIMIQRAVEKACEKGFKPRKIHEVPKTTPTYSSSLPPQWVTLKALGEFFARGFWPNNLDPYKPLASILLFSRVVSITCRTICPKCDRAVRTPNSAQQDKRMVSNDSACEFCSFSLSSDCRQASLRASFSDSNGGVAFLLNNADLLNMLGAPPEVAVDETTLKELLEKQLFRRFVLVFQILDFKREEQSFNLRTIRVQKPVREHWVAYLEVANS